MTLPNKNGAQLLGIKYGLGGIGIVCIGAVIAYLSQDMPSSIIYGAAFVLMFAGAALIFIGMIIHFATMLKGIFKSINED